MLEMYKFVFYILCIALLMVPNNFAREEPMPPEPNFRPVPDKPVPDIPTTTDDGAASGPFSTLAVTDLAQSKIDDALNLDFGKYTTMSFHYESHQWMHSTELDLCYDDYTKCLTSLAVPMAVCIMHTEYKLETLETYCDAYLDNCRHGFRYWRIVGYGKCDWIKSVPILVEA